MAALYALSTGMCRLSEVTVDPSFYGGHPPFCSGVAQSHLLDPGVCGSPSEKDPCVPHGERLGRQEAQRSPRLWNKLCEVLQYNSLVGLLTLVSEGKCVFGCKPNQYDT